MKKIFITRTLPKVAVDKLENAGYVVVCNPHDRPLTKMEFMTFISNDSYDAIVTLLNDIVDSEALAEMRKSVKIISQYAVGYNNIDVAKAREMDIVVCNAKSSSGKEVAEHTVMLISALSAKLIEMDHMIRIGAFKGWDPMLLKATSLHDKTLGIIGAGDIGMNVMRICHDGFLMKVIYHDIKRNPQVEFKYGAIYKEHIEDILKESDFVSLHVPLIKETHHLIHEDNLKLMKRSAFLINTSRGAVIDENALAKALEERVIAGAGLDVFENEPQVHESLSLSPYAILTPHIASATIENRELMAEIVADNIIEYFTHHTSKNRVN